jgi:carboxypeptidase Q
MDIRRKRSNRLLFGVLVLLFAQVHWAPAAEGAGKYDALVRQLLDAGLNTYTAHTFLAELVTRAPHRLSGSPGAREAVALTMRILDSLGFQEVHAESVMVPHWVRGRRETGEILQAGKRGKRSVAVCALGGSVATPRAGITAEILEVHSFEELARMRETAKGKIIFFNRPMDPTKLHTFEAYGGAVDQRAAGAVHAAEAGGVAALARSITLAHDRVPHTGVMGYKEDITKVPAAAISTNDADSLSSLLKRRPHLKFRLVLDCQTFPDASSANVMGQITGSERPDEVIALGGHLDCWDKGEGAHDDGSGCAQAIEALRLLKSIGVRPKRTIRAVLFMNEENGTRGGKGYVVAPERLHEHHVAAIESDRGGFGPLGFSVQGDSALVAHVRVWQPVFAQLGIGRFQKGSGGVDISPIVGTGVPGFGLEVEDYRYFDYHHSDNDTLDKVYPRELEMGAIYEALLCYIIAQEGLPPGRPHGNVELHGQ